MRRHVRVFDDQVLDHHFFLIVLLPLLLPPLLLLLVLRRRRCRRARRRASCRPYAHKAAMAVGPLPVEARGVTIPPGRAVALFAAATPAPAPPTPTAATATASSAIAPTVCILTAAICFSVSLAKHPVVVIAPFVASFVASSSSSSFFIIIIFFFFCVLPEHHGPADAQAPAPVPAARREGSGSIHRVGRGEQAGVIEIHVRQAAGSRRLPSASPSSSPNGGGSGAGGSGGGGRKEGQVATRLDPQAAEAVAPPDAEQRGAVGEARARPVPLQSDPDEHPRRRRRRRRRRR